MYKRQTQDNVKLQQLWRALLRFEHFTCRYDHVIDLWQNRGIHLYQDILPAGCHANSRKTWSWDGCTRDRGDLGNYLYAVAMHAIADRMASGSWECMQIHALGDEKLGDVLEAIMALGWYRRERREVPIHTHAYVTIPDVEWDVLIFFLEHMLYSLTEIVTATTDLGFWLDSESLAIWLR